MCTELSSRMQIAPGQSPSSSSTPNVKSPAINTTIKSTPSTPLSSSPHNNNNLEFSPSPSRLSTFFSNVLNLGGLDPYDSGPDRVYIRSVGPAVCPLNGGCIAIQGDNLEKESVYITIGGQPVKTLMKMYYSVLIVGPARSEEGEADLVICDGKHLLSKQSLFYTNSCFQTEKDVEDINKYAFELYQKAAPQDSPVSQNNNNQNQNLISPPTGTKITLHLKYPIRGSAPLVTVGGVSVPTEIQKNGTMLCFMSPPSSKEGYHTIEFMYNSKYLELPNLLYYQASSKTAAFAQHDAHSTPVQRETPIAKSTRVWGKKE
eukprot:gene7455-8721_t